MITSNDCWVQSTCKKHHNEQCEPGTFCIKLFKLNALYEQSLLAPSQRYRIDLMLDENRADEAVFTRLKDIQDNIEAFISSGSNLYLYSTITGNGKTAWAVRLLQTYLNNIWYKSDICCKALFISVPRYLLAIKDNINQTNDYACKIKENVYSADLVIWDDIGTKSATSFEHENLLSIIDTRMNANKCNIFTSNIVPEGIRQLAGERLYSRIINYSECLQFTGSDKRGLKF